MPYIYKIVNDINNKVYIGKTIYSIEKRFKEHCNDAFKERNEKRPLYTAMRKYGVKHFHIEIIEECQDLEKLSEQEIKWIKFYNSYYNGYNATKGGDGKILIDREKVINTYKQIQNISEVARQLNISKDAVTYILKNANIPIINRKQVLTKKLGHKVKCIDKNNNVFLFNSQMEAARWLQKNNYTTNKALTKISYSIGRVISGKRKTAFGFRWELDN